MSYRITIDITDDQAEFLRKSVAGRPAFTVLERLALQAAEALPPKTYTLTIEVDGREMACLTAGSIHDSDMRDSFLRRLRDAAQRQVAP